MKKTIIKIPTGFIEREVFIKDTEQCPHLEYGTTGCGGMHQIACCVHKKNESDESLCFGIDSEKCPLEEAI